MPILSAVSFSPWVSSKFANEHPYRRKWATERKHLSLKDVAAAGGWKDVETLLTCYQQPDPQTLLAVMSEPRKLHELAP